MNSLLGGILFLCIALRNHVNAHGYMSNPPSRSYIWHDKKFQALDPHVNYNYMGLNCGGLATQVENGGKCGVCGDNINGPRENEPGPQGKYAQGIISKCYSRDSVIDVEVHLTSNHLGWMEWRLCEQDDPEKTSNQNCFDDNLLEIVGISGDNWIRDGARRLKIDPSKQKSNDNFYVSLFIPNDVKCEACVLQWIYKAGNNWGCDNIDGVRVCGIGHGNHQEEFRNCADIAIRDLCPNDVLGLHLNQIKNHGHSIDSSNNILHVSQLTDDDSQHDASVHLNKPEVSLDLQPPTISPHNHGVHINNNPPIQRPAVSQEDAHGRLINALHQHLQRFNPLNPSGLDPIESNRNFDLPVHSTLGTEPISSFPLHKANNRHVGTCQLKIQSSSSNQQLKHFCSDRNCQVDYVNRECICY